MKQRLKTYVVFIALSSIIGSLGLIVAGCKTKEHIQVIQPQTIVTNSVPVKAFNDEYYVWEGFIFSTNQVKEVKTK